MFFTLFSDKCFLTTNNCFLSDFLPCYCPTASLQRSDPSNKCSGYDSNQSDGDVEVMLELWRMWSTPSLPLLPGPLWPKVVALVKGHIYGLNRTKLWFEFNVFGI